MNWEAVLGVAPDNTIDAIRKKYRKLALKTHPDKPGGNKATFQRLQHAWERAQREYRGRGDSSSPVHWQTVLGVHPGNSRRTMAAAYRDRVRQVDDGDDLGFGSRSRARQELHDAWVEAQRYVMQRDSVDHPPPPPHHVESTYSPLKVRVAVQRQAHERALRSSKLRSKNDKKKPSMKTVHSGKVTKKRAQRASSPVWNESIAIAPSVRRSTRRRRKLDAMDID